MQLYVLCAVDDEGMNVLEVADGHLHVGTRLRITWRSWWISCRLRCRPEGEVTVGRNCPMDR